ncbi:MAG TPA: MbcA/ParS/Xre antitoxin family protein [Rhizomicrobium sp.]|nr:MbcA/ParS/Xre antitoxin family protein [Rhizomicrobium sp.]
MKLEKAIATDGSPSQVLTKAVVRAGEHLGLPNAVLGRMLGLSPPTITRMRRGQYILEGKAFELATLFIRIYRSLDAIVGGDAAVAAQWLQSENTVLKDKPVNMLQKVTGLFNVIQYLDSRRAIS